MPVWTSPFTGSMTFEKHLVTPELQFSHPNNGAIIESTFLGRVQEFNQIIHMKGLAECWAPEERSRLLKSKSWSLDLVRKS